MDYEYAICPSCGEGAYVECEGDLCENCEVCQ